MIKAKRKLQQIDYQNSYFYQQQNKIKRTRRFKIFLLLMLPVMFLTSVMVVTASEIQSDKFKPDNALISAPKIVFNHPNPAFRQALPVDIEADIKVSGLIAYSEIKQVFINPHHIELEGIYQFPLPSDAAVNYMEIKIGDRVIEGTIKEKHEAKQIYAKAKRQGKKASLVEQQRPNLFTNKVANIPPFSQVVVTLRLITPIKFDQGEFSLSLPLAMTERYRPQEFASSPAELDSTILPVFARSEIKAAQGKANINVKLDAGLPVTGIQSISHGIIIKTLNNEQSKFQVTLDSKQSVADRQFVLNWRLPEQNVPAIASFTEQVGDEYFTLLTFFPAQGQDEVAVMPRDVVFVIDTSGSMQGDSLIQAKASLKHALTLLTKQDSFNIIEFNSHYTSLFRQNRMVSPESIADAQTFVERLQANGGTEMYQPLAQALMMQQSLEQIQTAIKQIVFITDGAVSNEFELMQLLENKANNHRLFTVGIGRAPNGYFMRKAAQFGRGSYVFIHNSGDVLTKMSNLMEKISQPAVSNIELMFDQQVHQELEVFPKKLPDLYVGEPLQVAIKSKLPIASLQVIGEMSNKPWYQQLLVENADDSLGVSTMWARRKVESLLDGLVLGEPVEQVKQKVIKTSIAHQIISPYTSFVAVEKQPEPALIIAKNQPARLVEAMQVALPQTALGWKMQLIIGFGLLCLFYISAGKLYARSYS